MFITEASDRCFAGLVPSVFGRTMRVVADFHGVMVQFRASGERVGMVSRRIAVVLFQLGGPDTLEAIEPFLFNLFCDPDIIDFPGARIGRKPLAKLISSTRAKKVQHHYATIGGGSPIRRNTERQARALQDELRAQGLDAH